MTVLEYLQLKYNVQHPTTLLKREAVIFGIEYPLVNNWIADHGNNVITPDMSLELRFYFMRRLDKAFYQSGLDLLGGTLTPEEIDYITELKQIKPLTTNQIEQKNKKIAKGIPDCVIERRIARKEKLASRKVRKQNKKRLVKAVKQPTQNSVKTFISKSSIDPTLDSFLNTFEWKAIRKMALNLHGSKCQCCGISVKDGAVMNVDHIKPRKFYPKLALDIDNLQVLCSDCNQGKGNWDMTDSRQSLLIEN